MVVASTDLAQSSTRPPLSDGQLSALLEACSRGIHPRELAKRLHPHDRQARRVAYRRLMHHMLYDERVAQAIREEVQVSFMVGLPPAGRALSNRSAARDVRAIKLLLEATGVHNPRIQHEHSGEIRIKFDIPRPTFESDDDIVDADVVE